MTDITQDPTALQAGQDQARQVEAAASQPQADPQADPQANPQVAPQPDQAASQVPQAPQAQAPTPAQQHTGWFHGMMARMNQGDQQVIRDKNGNPVPGPDGKPQTQPLSSKQMGRSILAGVLSAMVATEQHQPYRNGNGIWVNQGNEAAQAADQAFQQRRPQAQYQKADKQLSDQRTQQYAIYQHNVEMFKQFHDMYHAQSADQQAAAEEYKGGYEAGEAGQLGDAYQSELGDLDAKDAEAKMKTLDPTQNIMVPNGKVVPVLDPVTHKPTGETEMHWMVLKGNGRIPLTQDMIDNNPQLKGAAVGKTIPLTQFYKLVNGKAQTGLLQGMFNDVADAQNAAFPTKDFKSKNFDYAKFAKDSQATPDQLKQLGQLSADRDNPGVFAKGLKAIDTTGQMDQALRNQGIKIDAQAWEDKRKEALKKDEAEDTAKIAEVRAAAEAAAKANTPAGQAALRNTQLEIQLKQQALNQAAAQTAGVQVPKNFTPNPEAVSLGQSDLQNDLQKQGVKIPDDFAGLYAIGHNAADLATYTSSPRKGVAVMPRPAALAFIRQYINPQYQEGDYKAASGLSKELASTRQGTAGGSLLSAGVASNHLELLIQAASALQNGDTQLLNKLGNAAGVQFGKTPAVTFKAIADQVNQEVGKVVAGGTPHEAELQNLRTNLNSDQSPEQTLDVAKAYVGLMSGRVNEINDRSQQYFGRDAKGVSPAVTRVFNKYGFAVGSQVTVIGKNGNPHIFNDKKSADAYKKAAGIQ